MNRPRYRTLDGDELELPLAMDRWVLVPRTLARFDPELAWTLDYDDAPGARGRRPAPRLLRRRAPRAGRALERARRARAEPRPVRPIAHGGLVAGDRHGDLASDVYSVERQALARCGRGGRYRAFHGYCARRVGHGICARSRSVAVDTATWDHRPTREHRTRAGRRRRPARVARRAHRGRMAVEDPRALGQTNLARAVRSGSSPHRPPSRNPPRRDGTTADRLRGTRTHPLSPGARIDRSATHGTRPAPCATSARSPSRTFSGSAARTVPFGPGATE